MWRTVRSQLLLSYALIIAAVLLIVGLGLLIISASSTRIPPTLQQLTFTAQSVRRELLNLPPTNRPLSAEKLKEISAGYTVRILLLNPETDLILFDSETENSWVGIELTPLDRSNRAFSSLDRALPAGRFVAPDQTRWIIYSQAIGPSNSRQLLLFAQPEPTAIAFFSTTFFGPLLQAGIAAFLLSVLLATLISRSIAKPLQQMATAAQKVSNGAFKEPLSLSGPDEVQTLANSFNSMVAQIDRTQHAQKQFIANISHDLKTPLTSIQGWSQALLDGTAASPENQQRAASIIHTEAARMNRMVNQLLDLARIESGQLQLQLAPIDLSKLIQDLYHSLLMPAREKGVYLTINLNENPTIMGDYDRLMQIFTNISSNALTHTESGGRIDFSTKQKTAAMIEIRIHDTGVGIPEDELNHIFDRFYQIDQSRTDSGSKKGTGLGLSIVKELVTAHHGEIEIRSRVGEGTMFIVRLPTAH